MELGRASGWQRNQVDESVVHLEGRGVNVAVWGVGIDFSVLPPLQVCPGRQSSHMRVEGMSRLLVELSDEGEREKRDEKLLGGVKICKGLRLRRGEPYVTQMLTLSKNSLPPSLPQSTVYSLGVKVYKCVCPNVVVDGHDQVGDAVLTAWVSVGPHGNWRQQQ